jgi:hypothetical protein
MDWRKASLKLLREVPFAALFRDLKGETKFEASGLAHVNNSYYVVFDSHRSLGHVDDRLEMLSTDNSFVGEMGEESQFEGLTYRTDTHTFLAVQESHQHQGTLKPLVEELQLYPNGSSYHVINKCVFNYEMTHENKGIEGLQFWDAGDKGKYLLAICEGNHCEGGRKGRDSGNGRVLVAKLNEDGNGNETCSWEVEKVVKVPATADFIDYSGMSFRGDRFGIISQENSAMWVGDFDFDKMEFSSDGEVYYFPRDNECNMVYCTVEGLDWIDDDRIIVTSDRSKADQKFVCASHDQAVAVFMLPHGAY